MQFFILRAIFYKFYLQFFTYTVAEENKTRSEITLLNWRQSRRDKLTLFMPGQHYFE